MIAETTPGARAPRGVLPLRTVAGAPGPDLRLDSAIPPPGYLARFRLG